ncbi:PREDICTED: gibberellin-regulated protein 11-like [Tarenaya hassleriana]|uniref:gibberellin-regulated protein 11-like n=1 Tax=Tarenaya hassleriana TaxID=28532 RepID=UPI00053C705C|nr:PREDICTED: gibberellin-regulated protein 11-like [Tarenaya hassleriana]
MALSKTLISCTVLSLFILNLIHAAEVPTETVSVAQPPAPPKIDCTAECERRCILSKRGDTCRRVCGECCATCGCVPPGTWGQYEACPCYGQQKTHGGRQKCP